MALSSRLARPMLAAMFVSGGLDAVRNPEGKVKAAEKVVQPMLRKLPELPQDTETFVKINGAVQVGAGLLLAIGKFRRVASLVLIGSVIPTTLAGHRFWEEVDDAARRQQQVHFLKNLGLLGGLILAAADTEGAPSLGWRSKRWAGHVGSSVSIGAASGGQKAQETAARLAAAGGRSAHRANEVGGRAARRANEVGGRAARRANEVGGRAARRANEVGGRAARRANEVAKRAGHDAATASDKALHVGKLGAEAAGAYVSTGLDHAGDLLAKVHDLLPVG